jgi:cytochrome c biogenesis protein CcmG/thiol:disulfide interchange protein DsbE
MNLGRVSAPGSRLSALILVLTACSGSSADSGGRVEVGAPAPSYRAVSLAGDSVSLADQKGKVVLLNIWATWCHPCRDEIPDLRKIHAQYKDRGLELVGVSVDADGAEQNIRDFMKEFEMTYPVWLDPAERISARFLTIGVPTTFLIDRDGILRWRRTGPVAVGDTSLTNAIERALGG